MESDLFVGVDAGTLSVRAGVFDLAGRCLGTAASPVTLHRPRPDFAEQSSEEIWNAAGKAVREAITRAGVAPERVRGIGFDATCSLVLLDTSDAPLSADPEGSPERNVIVWMDHRATEQADRLSATGAEALRYVGGRLSPEMEVPKLAWLAERLPGTFARIGKALDLADYLVYRAAGDDPRSVCTVVCKWGYLAAEERFDRDLYRAAGIEAVLEEGRAGRRVAPLGASAGNLTAAAAAHLGLTARAAVAVGIIDAHAGGLGTLGNASPLCEELAIIAGTSACHMAVSPAPCFVPGVWGPYLGAMVPGMWLSEGGQSAAGALLLIGTPEKAFMSMVPLLIGAATALFAFAGRIRAWIFRHAEDAAANSARADRLGLVLLAPVAVYGGYFGAGMSVMLLAILSLGHAGDFRTVNVLKNLLSGLTSIVAVAIFVVQGAVSWPETIAMMLGALIGGYAGGRLARVLPAAALYWIVVAIGSIITVHYARRYWWGL